MLTVVSLNSNVWGNYTCFTNKDQVFAPSDILQNGLKNLLLHVDAISLFIEF